MIGYASLSNNFFQFFIKESGDAADKLTVEVYLKFINRVESYD